MPAPRSLYLLALAATTAVILLSAAPAAARPGGRHRQIGAIFGSAPGEPRVAVQEAARRAGVVCAGRDATTLLCAAPASAELGAGRASYWFDDERLTRIAVVAAAPTHAAAAERFDRIARALGARLGRPSTAPVALPAWFVAGSDGGRVARSATWTGDPTVTLELRATDGAPHVVVAVAARPARCSPERTADLLVELFPPAAPADRQRALAALGACGAPRTAGPIAAVLAHEADPALREGAAAALGAVGGDAAANAVREAARSDPDRAVRRAAVRQLGRLGDLDAATAIARDDRWPAELRDEALWQAAHGGAWPADAELRQHARGWGGARALLALSDPAAARDAAAAGAPGSLAMRRGADAPASAEAPVAPIDPYTSTPTSTPLRESIPGGHPLRESIPGGHPTPHVPRMPAPSTAATPPSRTAALSLPVGSTSTAEAVVAAAPAAPRGPADGTALAVATTTAAAAGLFPTLAAMAEVDDVGSLLLTGTAGAVIGAGTSLGIFKFARARPTLAQSAWYTNVVAWGALAGLNARNATLDESPKVRNGLFAAGQVLGLGLGAWSAARFDFTLAQTVLADSLVLSAGLAGLGFDLVRDQDPQPSVESAWLTVPVMIGSAWAAHSIAPTARDLRMIGVATPALGWTGGLLAAGVLERPLSSRVAVGGAALGLAAGYVATTLASPFVEVAPRRTAIATGGMLAGNGFGLGLGMVVAPDTHERWPLGAALGGIGFGAAAYLLEPHVTPGPRWPAMTTAGGFYGGGTLLLAALAGRSDDDQSTRVAGGVLSGGILGSAAGLIASQWFRPTPRDQLKVAALTGAGTGVGLGVARLAVERRGAADSLGVLGGAGAGFALGAIAAHYSEPRLVDALGYALGGAVGGFAGALLPTLDDDAWSDERPTQGGGLLGAGLGAVGGAVMARALDARPGQIGAAALATGFGTSIGHGIGETAPSATSRPERTGALFGQLGGLAAAIAAEPWLRLGDGVGAKAVPMAMTGGALGVAYGALAATLVSPGATTRTQTRGGATAGGSFGVASGLVLSKWFAPTATDHWVAVSGSALGHSFGFGVAQLAVPAPGERSRADASARLAGGLGGLTAGALAANRFDFTRNDFLAGALGAAYGGFLGSLATTLDETTWTPDREVGGGANLGLAIGGALAATASRATDATAAEIAVPATGGALGAGLGLGVGLMASDQHSQVPRIGVVIGTAALGAGAALGSGALQLTRALPQRARLAWAGGGLGSFYGLLATSAIHPHGQGDDIDVRHYSGGFLAGSSAGVAAGLASAPWLAPTRVDVAIGYGGATLGASAGLGLGLLAFDEHGRADASFAMAGSLAGLGAAALAQRFDPLRPADGGGLAVGMGFGGLIGTLAPTLDRPTFDGLDRATSGGLLLGGGGGAIAGAAIAHLTHATGEEIAVPAVGGALGAGLGVGLGLLASEQTSQAPRIGTVIGTAALGAGAALSSEYLQLTGDRHPQRARLAVAGGGLGTAYGALVTRAIYPRSQDGEPDADGRHFTGGMLAGGSAGVAAGLASARWLDPSHGDLAIGYGGAALGAGAGLGVARLAYDEYGRADSSFALAGSLAGLGAAALAQRFDPLRPADGGALAVGIGFGGLIGTLAPTLDRPSFGELDRTTSGGLLLGGAGGGLAGATIAHLSHADPRTTGLAAAGGGHGLATGLGIGLLIDDDDRSQARRIGAVAGSSAGLALGALWLPRARFTAADASLIGGATLVGGWSGALLPALGHAEWSTVGDDRIVGGAMAGGGLASLAGALVASRIDVDPVRVRKALLIDALLTGAGVGAGALATPRAEGPVWGALAGGTGGLVLGGALADHVEISERHAPLSLLATAQGGWTGGWLPFVLHDEPTARQVSGGGAAGAFGGLGLATLLGERLSLTPGQAGRIALASGLGTSIAGGAALVARDRSSQERAGLLLGGTTAGTALGAWLMPRVPLDARARWMAAAGGGLGATEGWVFAWAGGSEDAEQYWGATLVGGGVGATLGLAGASSSRFTGQRMLVSSGFAAWGGWIGSFSGGALVDTAPRSIVLGGMIGANVGLASGYALTRADLFRPEDFGWLSLAGAIGTVGGAGTGALFSSKENRTPILLGLAIGPVAGMAAGGAMLPLLRKLGGSPSSSSSSSSKASVRRRRHAAGGNAIARALGRSLGELVDVDEWQPMFGALPSLGLSADATPAVGGGVTGTLH